MEKPDEQPDWNLIEQLAERVAEEAVRRYMGERDQYYEDWERPPGRQPWEKRDDFFSG